MPHVLVAGKIHEAGIAILRDAGFAIRAIDAVSTESYAPHLGEADAILIRTQPLTAREVAAAPRLRIVSRHGVGYDAVDLPALEARQIPLTIVGDVNALAVAEQTLASMLALAKRMRTHDAAVREGRWEVRQSFGTSELSGKQLFLVGFGRIGRRVAAMAAAFGMKVAAFDPFQAAEAIRAGGARPERSIEAGLEAADYVSLHLPRDGARPLIGAGELARMKPGAFLINTARGGLIDETALAEALEAGRLGGAALDVFETEPPAANNPLLRSDRVLLSPHIAGLSVESAIRMSEAAARNIVDFFAGKLVPAMVVNKVRLGVER